MDVALYLEFKTCPKELKRILELDEFEVEVKQSPPENWGESEDYTQGNWFSPETLGKNVLVCFHKKDRGNYKRIYASSDSTRAYYIEWFN